MIFVYVWEIYVVLVVLIISLFFLLMKNGIWIIRLVLRVVGLELFEEVLFLILGLVVVIINFIVLGKLILIVLFWYMIILIFIFFFRNLSLWVIWFFGSLICL